MRRTTTADAAGQKNGEKNRNNKKNALELKFRLFSLRFFCISIYFIFFILRSNSICRARTNTANTALWKLTLVNAVVFIAYILFHSRST